MRKKLMWAGITAVLLTSTACHHEKEKEEKVKFTVTSPIRKDTLVTREYVCQIRGIQHIELRALERGYLQEIFVDEGKFVKKGQLMFQILPIIYQAEAERAKAEANFAEIEYKNTERLADSNIVSPNELALAKAKYAKAIAELDLMKAHLFFTQITAPFDGIMDRFQVRLGSLLDEGDLLTTLSDISTLWVYFNVPEAEYLNYMQNTKKDSFMTVQLRMANQQMFQYPGVVKTIEAEFNHETGNIAFRATFPNPDMLLRHGETGNVVVTVPLKNALLIPQKSVFEVLDQRYVYVVDKNNVLKTRRIHVASEMPDLYVIESGLQESDKILLDGLRLVNDNDTIQYEYQKPLEVMKHLKLHAE
ncbi:MAG: efflux RND transporter periplasmic adaptor subunit [Bacteroidetes bacterium]|nr:efflux RND transporter periplasmic adaptor subunit [Bacteroidota bacterium]